MNLAKFYDEYPVTDEVLQEKAGFVPNRTLSEKKDYGRYVRDQHGQDGCKMYRSMLRKIVKKEIRSHYQQKVD